MMSDSKKTSQVPFVVKTALIVVALIAAVYCMASSHRFLAPESDSSATQQEKNSNSPLPSSQTPALEKELVKLPGGDVGYASDVAKEDLPSITSVAETVPAQSTSDSDSLPLAFESNDVQTTAPSTPEIGSLERDEAFSASSVSANDVKKPSLDDALDNPELSIAQDDQNAEFENVTRPSDELYDLPSAISHPFQNGSVTNADPLANALVATTSGDDPDKVISNDLAFASNPTDEKALVVPSVQESVTNDLLNENDSNSNKAFVQDSDVSTNSAQSFEELAANDLPEPDDKTADMLPKDNSDVSTNSAQSFEELAANDPPKPNDQTADMLPRDNSDVSTNSAQSSSELVANDLPEPDDQTADMLPKDNSDVSTNSASSFEELAANDLPEPDDKTADMLPKDNSDVSTNSAPSFEELAANDPPEPDNQTADMLPKDNSDVSTNSAPSFDKLVANDLSKSDDQKVNILQLDDSDVSTDSVPSFEELVTNDLSKPDNLEGAADSTQSFNELTVGNLSKTDVTDVLKTSDSSSADFGVNDLSKSDGWTSWHSDSSIETLPDGLGTISSKPVPDGSSSILQDDVLVVNQTSQSNDARISEIVKPNDSKFDLSSFELLENEPTNYYLERWNTLDQAWQEYLAPLSDEERLSAIDHNQSQMDKICLVIAERLAFADDLSVNKRDGFFRLYASLLANAGKMTELTSLLMKERANKPTNDARPGYLEVLIFETRVQSAGAMKDSDGLLNLSKELIQAASTSDVKYFLRKTKYLANLIGQYDKNLGERTFSVICQEFANSQDKFRRNMPNVFAGEARFESLPGNELLLGGMSVDGRDVDLLNYRGKTTLVVFTNSSCAPYLDELPSLRDVYAKYHNAGFEIVEYNLDVDVDGLRKFIKAQNIPWTVVSQRLTAQVDGRDFVNPCVYYGIANLPTAILLDKNGKVISALARRGRLTEELSEIYPNVH